MANLERALGLKECVALVVGTIIGSGVFLKSSTMAQYLGSPFYVLAAWVVAGLLSLAGALIYAEIGARFPQAGGEYVYLREAYGSLPAFLYGWMRFWIASPGSIAAYAVGAATFIDTAILRSEGSLLSYWIGVGGKPGFALILVVFFTLLNCLRVMIGGQVQALLTAMKVLLVVGLTLGILSVGGESAVGWQQGSWLGEWPGFSAFGGALVAALWAYDGWNNLPMMAGEVKDAERNIPRALVLGTALILVIYGGINFAYFYALSVEEVASASSRLHPDAPALAAKAASVWLGPVALSVLLGVFAFSSISGMHGSIMTNARVPFAMARDGLFFKELGRIHPVTQVPVVSILIQGLVSCVLAASGTFDQLTDYVVFASWIFYGLVIYSVFIFRKRDEVLSRSGRRSDLGSGVRWILPVLMLGASAWLFLNTLVYSPRESFFGLALIVSGAPAYYWMKRRGSRSER